MQDKKTVSILLVEDNPGDARLVEIYLQESTMMVPDIKKVTELHKGLLMLEENDYDVVLLDLTLPDSTGFNTVKKMLDEFPAQTVIVMTGLEDETMAINSVQTGAQDFIVKGQFDSNLLSKTITYAIQRHALQKKLETYAQTIKLNEQRLLEAQKMARIGNWELDTATNKMYWSEEVFRILGYKENSINPTLNDYLKYVDQNDADTLKMQISQTMEKGHPFQVDYKVTLPGNIVKVVTNHGQTQLSKKSGSLCLVGTIQDITSLAKTEARVSISDLASNLNQLLQELNQLSEMDGSKAKQVILNSLKMLSADRYPYQ